MTQILEDQLFHFAVGPLLFPIAVSLMEWRTLAVEPILTFLPLFDNVCGQIRRARSHRKKPPQRS